MLFAAQVSDLFAGGRSSCDGYIEIFAAQFAREQLSREWNFQSQKTLRKFFFKSFLSSVLTAGPGDLHVT